MKFTQTLWAGVALVLAVTSTWVQADEYKLSSDDKIAVTVFEEPELSIKEIKIASDGNVSFPLIGEVQVTGLTTSEVEQKLKSLLAPDYLKHPEVTVAIVEYRPFYINGEVKNPGSYPYRKNLTLEKAVALAGGFTERAKKSQVNIANKEKGRQITSRTLEETIKPGDVITVDESFF
ncbi:polysaccharide export protein [Salinimonas marina]|uniref:Polysaccharide export protein n=1 Tax=Salinimonas marina TaxID=2785918 RepID=A0A7S9DWG4_9ALTE|nr:polysaccharide biosynthesis/export family protein [Salinimonas marina]QPG05130.1 polysaccharide export protein [Salinimonas marina]